MNFLDRLAFNRLVAIILNFIVTLIKIFAPKAGAELEKKCPTVPNIPKPPLKRKPLFPRNKDPK
jgi:hypothetical protein